MVGPVTPRRALSGREPLEGVRTRLGAAHEYIQFVGAGEALVKPVTSWMPLAGANAYSTMSSSEPKVMAKGRKACH